MLAILAVSFAKVLPAVAGYAARGVYLSLYLGIFNMIPIPPLDGSKLLLAARFPVFLYRELAHFGFILLLLLISYTNIGYQMSAWSILGREYIFRLLQ